jgi:hypothetical protein
MIIKCLHWYSLFVHREGHNQHGVGWNIAFALGEIIPGVTLPRYHVSEGYDGEYEYRNTPSMTAPRTTCTDVVAVQTKAEYLKYIREFKNCLNSNFILLFEFESFGHYEITSLFPLTPSN